MKLYTFTHSFNKYETYKVVALNRSTANLMLRLHCESITNFDGKLANFACIEEHVDIQLSESVAYHKVFGN